MLSVRTRKPPVEGGTRVGASMQPSGVRHDVTRTTKAKAAITKQTLGQCIAEKRCGCGMPQEALAEQLRAVSPAGTQVLVTGLSPIIGAHTGPGALTVCHFGTGRMG